MNSIQLKNFKDILRIVLIGCIILTTMAVISVIVFGQLGRLEVKVIMSTVSAAGVSMLALVCAHQIGSYRRSAWTGIGFAGLTLVLSLCAIWIERDYRWSAELWQCVAAVWVVTLTFAYLCGLFSRDVSGWIVTLRKTACVIGILWAMATILVIFNPTVVGIKEVAFIKTAGILGVTAVSSALIIFIYAWLKK